MIIDICNKVNSFHRERGGGGALAVTLKASLLLQNPNDKREIPE